MEFGKTELGDRMKMYEKESTINYTNHIVIRVDGNNFSKFTKMVMKKPFDAVFTKAMVNTMNEMIGQFNISTAFCCSDEITFVIRSTPEGVGHAFNGRVHKLNSLISGKCSVLFLINILKEIDDQTTRANILECAPCFDSRIMEFDKTIESEISRNIYWRSCHDCYRNCISSIGRFIIGNKMIHKKNTLQIAEMMKNQYSFDVENIPMCLRYGVYAKKFTVCKVNDAGEQYERTVVKNFTFKINPEAPGIIDYILQKKDSCEEYKKFSGEIFEVNETSYSFS